MGTPPTRPFARKKLKAFVVERKLSHVVYLNTSKSSTKSHKQHACLSWWFTMAANEIRFTPFGITDILKTQAQETCPRKFIKETVCEKMERENDTAWQKTLLAYNANGESKVLEDALQGKFWIIDYNDYFSTPRFAMINLGLKLRLFQRIFKQSYKRAW